MIKELKKEIDFRREMADLGFYNIHLMKGLVLANYINYGFSGEKTSESGIMFGVYNGEIEIESQWMKENLSINIKKLNKAFELIKEFYSQN